MTAPAMPKAKSAIRNLLSTLKEAAQGKNAERAKVKNKDREVSL